MLTSSSICILMMTLSCEASHIIKTHFVFWNSSNPIFRLDNTDHVIDVNVNTTNMEYDQLNLICPQNSSEEELHIIYSVSREEFQDCRVLDQNPKIVAVCNQPGKFQYFTITFRHFSPTPGGLEFRPGQEYYFISTANKRDIHRRVGGWCSSHNMKMIVKVAESEAEKQHKEQTTSFSPIPSPAAFWSNFKQRNKLTEHFHQSAGETYFKENLEFRDASVDISITGRSLTSLGSQVITSSASFYTTLLLTLARSLSGGRL